MRQSRLQPGMRLGAAEGWEGGRAGSAGGDVAGGGAGGRWVAPGGPDPLPAAGMEWQGSDTTAQA